MDTPDRHHRKQLRKLIKRARKLARDPAADIVLRNFERFVAEVHAQPDPRVLELGARVFGGSVAQPHFDDVEKVGFDVQPGQNVDVVGDAHELSEHFEPESFSAVFSISVFEHLAAPWQVVLEMNRVLRPGGLVLVWTHHSWPPHELPADYWRFSEQAMHVLFHARTGFEVLCAAEGMPARIFPMVDEPTSRPLPKFETPMCTTLLARKTGPPAADLAWRIDPSTLPSYPDVDEGA